MSCNQKGQVEQEEEAKSLLCLAHALPSTALLCISHCTSPPRLRGKWYVEVRAPPASFLCWDPNMKTRTINANLQARKPQQFHCTQAQIQKGNKNALIFPVETALIQTGFFGEKMVKSIISLAYVGSFSFSNYC